MIHSQNKAISVIRDHFPIPELGEGLELPYIEIHGAHDGPRLTLLAGVHGCEYAGMAALRAFIAGVDPAELHGTITAVPVVNLPAYRNRTPFVVPVDGKNLNRCFPGDPNGTYSDVLAHHVFERFIRGADYVIDLHAGDLPEALEAMAIYDESPVVETARRMALAFGTNHVIKQPAAARTIGGSTSVAAADAGVPAIIGEAGGNGIADEHSIAIHLRGLRNVASELGMLPYAQEPALNQIEHDTGWNWLYTPVGGWWEPLAELDKHVEEGEVVGLVSDLFGDVIHEVKAPEAGTPLFITTSPAVVSEGLLMALAREV